MIKLGENSYKLLFLDTNVLREITQNTNNSQTGFLKRFIESGDNYAPCFSFYNVVEIMPYSDIFESFLRLFSAIPCMMFFSVKSIIDNEYQCYLNKAQFVVNNTIANAFTPIIDNERYNFGSLLKQVWQVKHSMQ